MTIFIRIDYQTEWTAFLPLNPLTITAQRTYWLPAFIFYGKKVSRHGRRESRPKRKIEIKLLLSVSFTCGC